MTTATKMTGRFALMLLATTFLVVRCLYAVFIPGGEWPLPPLNTVAMLFDGALLVSVALLFVPGAPAVTSENGRPQLSVLVCVLGVLSGAILLAIRYSSEAAWWTGHLFNKWG